MLSLIFSFALALNAAGEFKSIQAAIDSAKDGEIIKVPPGIYKETIDFKGKSLKIVAWDYEADRPGDPRSHFIVSPGGGPVVKMWSSQIPANGKRVQMALEGFTVTGGSAEKGAGIYIGGNVFAEVYRCVVVGNVALGAEGVASGRGGGIYVEGSSSLTLISSLIVRNEAEAEGGAIYASGAPTLESRRGRLSVVNCTIAENRSGGPALFLVGLRGETCFVNNIIWGNVGTDFFSESKVPAKCNILGSASGMVCTENCLFVDPKFSEADVDPISYFTLGRDSPGRNAGCDPRPCLLRPFGAPPIYTDLFGKSPDGGRDIGPLESFVIFVRADVNQDGQPGDIGDAISILDYLFSGDSNSCLDSVDCNDDGKTDISDTIFLLLYLFQEGKPPNEPFPLCGVDPTPDPLDCRSYQWCQ